MKGPSEETAMKSEGFVDYIQWSKFTKPTEMFCLEEIR